MKIIITGASSFTGMHFALELAHRGHQVVCPLFRKEQEYIGLRKERVTLIQSFCDVHFGVPFGSDPFLKLSCDVLCHHAAEVSNYKSPQFDVAKALENNTHHLKLVLEKLNPKFVVLTGSVFEPGEGKGAKNLHAVSPYGLSKGLTAGVFQYYCDLFNTPFRKFVIPNPFGPYEESRFTTSLIRSWADGKTAEIHFPNYVRDNIPISLLAKIYAKFVEKKLPYTKISPSFYAEKQGVFATRFAKEMKTRLPLTCALEQGEQSTFSEPEIRINTDPIDLSLYAWDEKKAWDELATFYQSHYLEIKQPV